MTTSPAEWENSIDRLYDAVGREDRLAQALGAFRGYFGAQGVMFLTAPDATKVETMHIGAIGVSHASLVEYHSHFGQYDVWSKAAWRKNLYSQPGCYRGSELVPRQELKRSYFWNEFLLRDGVTDILVAMIDPPSESGPAMTLTFQRHHGQAPFVAGDVTRLALLAPHMRRAMRLHRRLAPTLAVGSTLLELFERLDVPMLFVAQDGSPVQINLAAQHVLDGPAAPLRLRAGRLGALGQQGWLELDSLLPRLQSEPSFDLKLLRQDGQNASLEVRRVHGAVTDRAAHHKAVAICTLHQTPLDPAVALREKFGLTTSEFRVARRLADGLTAEALAHELGVAVSTIRSHLKSAMAKVGVNRQAHLVAQVLGRSPS